MKTCVFPDCGRPYLSKGLCQTHYWQGRRGEALRPIQSQNKKPRQPCAFEGCERLSSAKGLCVGHRKQQLRGQELRPMRGARGACAVEGCGRKVSSKGHCQTHAKYRLLGQELKPIEPPSFRYRSSQGYIRVKDPGHPNAAKNGLLMEHTKVMSDHLGRMLWPDENVHHKNGKRDDNRLSNLELWSTRQPKGQRVEDKVEFAIEMLRRYRPDLLKEP